MDKDILSNQVEELIKGRQYEKPQIEKGDQLLSILKPLIRSMVINCPAYGRFLESLGGDLETWKTIADIPPLPVSMFKRYDLMAVPVEKVVRILQSSSTTGQTPSRMFVDKTTAFRQARALVAILKEHVGSARRPFLVLDAKESIGEGEQLTARGAAIRGIGNFASSTTFAMRRSLDDELVPDFAAVESFFSENADSPVLIFGFTFIAWSRFVAEAERRGISYESSDAILLHSGGWKKLTSQAVSKEIFNQRVSSLLGCPTSSILDFYGMVEQVGTVFVDCEEGNKHAPAFADVLVRLPNTMTSAGPGQAGIIEVVSVLPTSYPGQVLLTEDEGILVGVDDCPCGRLGSYFRFIGRVEEAEIRGCGDIFAATRDLQ